MNTARRKYQVHAELLESGMASVEIVDPKLRQLVDRGLNRMERIAAVYLGRICKRQNNSLQIAFDTAEAALLSACEMQHRCAALPQLPDNRLALRIGIHQGVELRRLTDDADCAIEMASLLAFENDGIVMSGIVLAALDPKLRKFVRPLSDLPHQIAAHVFDWRSEIPSAAYWGKSTWPDSEAASQNGLYLILRHNLQTLELTQDKPVLTIGRDPQNNLALASKHVSRNHCRIERREDRVVLTDSSSNGTFLVPDRGKELRASKSSVILTGTGMLFLGFRSSGERRGGIKYETVDRS